MPGPVATAAGPYLCTIGAVGDIVLSGPAAAAAERYGDDWLFAQARDVLARADILFGNHESIVLPRGFPPAAVDPRGLVSYRDSSAALRRAGFDVVSLANNHALDGGTIGLKHTRDALERAGIVTVGAGETQHEAGALRVLEHAGMQIGFLAYAEDSNYSLSTTGPGYAYYERDRVLADIAAAREQVDALVVSVHADLEFRETPSPARREAFRDFARAGATLVLGHHPHVPQGVELVGGSLIAYSLGNFVFHVHSSSYLSPHLPRTAQSFVLLAHISSTGVDSFERVPVVIGEEGERPVAAAGAEAAEIASVLEHLDRAVQDDELVAADWHAAALEQLTSRLRQIASLDDRDDVLHALATMVHVAENRAWVDEVAATLEQIWATQRARSPEHHRPGRDAPALAAPAGRRAVRGLVRRLVESTARIRRR